MACTLNKKALTQRGCSRVVNDPVRKNCKCRNNKVSFNHIQPRRYLHHVGLSKCPLINTKISLDMFVLSFIQKLMKYIAFSKQENVLFRSKTIKIASVKDVHVSG